MGYIGTDANRKFGAANAVLRCPSSPTTLLLKTMCSTDGDSLPLISGRGATCVANLVQTLSMCLMAHKLICCDVGVRVVDADLPGISAIVLAKGKWDYTTHPDTVQSPSEPTSTRNMIVVVRRLREKPILHVVEIRLAVWVDQTIDTGRVLPLLPGV